jgi:hypothetical protein
MYRCVMNLCNLDYMQLSWKGLLERMMEISIRSMFSLENKNQGPQVRLEKLSVCSLRKQEVLRLGYGQHEANPFTENTTVNVLCTRSLFDLIFRSPS